MFRTRLSLGITGHGMGRWELVPRQARHVPVGQINEVKNEAIILAIEMAINEAGSFDLERELVASDPADQIR
jgi:hypothetical protein